MLNRVWRCRTHTFYVIISQLAPPLPHRWTDDDAENGQAGDQARHKDGGAGVERCAPVTVYIYFSPCLSALVTPCLRFALRSISNPFRSASLSFARLAEVSSWAG